MKKSRKNLILLPELNGILKNLYVEEGGQVNEGDLLAEIDDSGLKNQLSQLELQAELSRIKFNRIKNLWEQKIGSEIEYFDLSPAIASFVAITEVSVGVALIIGGFIKNPNVKFGVNCFGPKPDKRLQDDLYMQAIGTEPRVTEDAKVNELEKHWKSQIDNVLVAPFNKDNWSSI